MTVAAELVGSLGVASLRVNLRMSDYASAATHGRVILGGPKNAPTQGVATSILLNEVGITDSVMAELWHGAPAGVAFGVSSGAETDHVGADLAIMDQSTNRILVYQAKIAELDSATSSLKFKSKSKSPQVQKLQTETVTVDSIPYEVTGRYCLYQSPQLSWNQLPGRVKFFLRHGQMIWPLRFGPAPELYFDEVLRRTGESSKGILAAAVPLKDVSGSVPAPVDSVPLDQCWPWEYDVALWLSLGRGESSRSTGQSSATSMSELGGSSSPFGVGGETPMFGPDGSFALFESDFEISDNGGDFVGGRAAEIAEQLGLADDEKLHLFQL